MDCRAVFGKKLLSIVVFDFRYLRKNNMKSKKYTLYLQPHPLSLSRDRAHLPISQPKLLMLRLEHTPSRGTHKQNRETMAYLWVHHRRLPGRTKSSCREVVQSKGKGEWPGNLV